MLADLLLWTDQPAAAEREILEKQGKVILRLSPALLVARLPDLPSLPDLRHSKVISEAVVDHLPADSAQLARAWLLARRLEKDTSPGTVGEGLSWDAPGFEAPDSERAQEEKNEPTDQG